jgi:hypothetical protein
MSASEDVVQILELWQSTLQEAAITGCTFTKSQ